jgi:hypothetical protein
MQIMIDTDSEEPPMLRLTASFLADAAAVLEGNKAGPQRRTIVPQPPMETGSHIPPIDQLGAASTALDPAKVFGGMPPVSTVPLPPLPLAPLPPHRVPPPGPQAPDEFDSLGMPYDSRIHNDKRSKMLNGAWKYRKKTPEALIAAVEAELAPRKRAVALPHGAQLPLPAVAAPVSPPPTVPLPPTYPPQAQGQESPQGAQGPTAGPIPPGSPPGITFRDVMTKITEGIASKKLSTEDIGTFLSSYQMDPKNIVAIGDHPELWPKLLGYIASMG